MKQILVLGAAGYVGSCYADHLTVRGFDVVRAGRRPSDRVDVLTSMADHLDSLLATVVPDQVLVTAQLRDAATGQLLERIDGPRWVILSSAQLASDVPAPGLRQALLHEELALARGAVVLRPTMIYGRGADLNISRLVRQLRRYRVALQAGGDQLVQPVHVDDLCDLLERHLAATPVPAGLMGKPVDVGGDAALPVCELLDDLVQLTAATQFRFVFGSRALRAMAVAGSLVGLRPDQVERLLEDKTAQNTVATEALGWHPEPTAVRLEQAVSEAGS